MSVRLEAKQVKPAGKKEFEEAVELAAKGEVLMFRNALAGKLTRETHMPCRESLGKGFSLGAWAVQGCSPGGDAVN